MLTVADLMTKSVVTLTEVETLAQAADTLSNLAVSGAPVCDANEKVVGVFSKSDLVNRLVDGRLDTNATVGAHMTRITVALRPTDTILRAAEVMAEKMIHRVVVVDDDGRLVGIVSPLDILKAVHDGRLELTARA